MNGKSTCVFHSLQGEYAQKSRQKHNMWKRPRRLHRAATLMLQETDGNSCQQMNFLTYSQSVSVQ